MSSNRQVLSAVQNYNNNVNNNQSNNNKVNYRLAVSLKKVALPGSSGEGSPTLPASANAVASSTALLSGSSPNAPSVITKFCENECSSEASLRCTTCGANLCNTCFEDTHKTVFMKRHIKVVLVQNPNNYKHLQQQGAAPLAIPASETKNYCPRHVHQLLDLYCVTCDKALCEKCKTNTNEHASHHVESLELFQEHLTNDIRQAEQKLLNVKAEMESQLALVQKDISQIEKRFTSVQQNMEQDFADLAKAVEARKKELVLQLNSIKQDSLQQKLGHVQNLESTIADIVAKLKAFKPQSPQGHSKGSSSILPVKPSQRLQEISDAKQRKQSITRVLETGRKLVIASKPTPIKLLPADVNNMMVIESESIGCVYTSEVKELIGAVKSKCSVEKVQAQDGNMEDPTSLFNSISPRSVNSLAAAQVDTKLKSVTSCINAVQILKTCAHNNTGSEETTRNTMQLLAAPLMTCASAQERAQCCSAVCSLGGIEIILANLLKYQKNPQIASDACLILSYVAETNTKAQARIDALDGVALVLAVLKHHEKAIEVAQAALLAIGNFAHYNAMADKIMNQRGIELLISCMKTHSKDRQIACASNFAMYMLGKNSENIRLKIASLGGTENIVESIKAFPNDEKLITLAVLALKKIYKKNKLV